MDFDWFEGMDGLGVDPECVYEVVADPYRRQVLTTLSEEEGPITVTDLANRIGGEEAGIAADGGSSRSLRQLQVALHHAHLPKMDDYGIVTYDREERLVKLAR